MKLVKFFAATIAAASMFVACEAPEENKGNGGNDVIVQEYVQILCDVTASDWDTVGVWAWLEGGANFTQSGEWPGDQLTETTEVDGKTVYIWNCPKELLGQTIQFILNDFNGVVAEDGSESREQTEDFSIVVAENLLVGLTEMGENGKWLMYGGDIFEKPEVEEQVVVLGDHTWGLIGVNGDWDNDIEMTVANGVATATAELPANGEFKVRADHGWDINYGFNSEDGSLAPVDGTKFAVAHNGSNIVVAEAGTYEVVLSIEGENEYLQITKK
jgi:hypothetical protein